MPQAFASILEAGEVDFTTLGGQEWCCGYPLLSMGRLGEARRLIQHNVKQAKALGAIMGALAQMLDEAGSRGQGSKAARSGPPRLV